MIILKFKDLNKTVGEYSNKSKLALVATNTMDVVTSNMNVATNQPFDVTGCCVRWDFTFSSGCCIRLLQSDISMYSVAAFSEV